MRKAPERGDSAVPDQAAQRSDEYLCPSELVIEVPRACVKFSVPFEKGTLRKDRLIFNFNVLLTSLSTFMVCFAKCQQISQVANI